MPATTRDALPTSPPSTVVPPALARTRPRSTSQGIPSPALMERARGGSGVSARDLVHAAVARRQGLREILTVDVGFGSIPGIVVIDPLEWVGGPDA